VLQSRSMDNAVTSFLHEWTVSDRWDGSFAVCAPEVRMDKLFRTGRQQVAINLISEACQRLMEYNNGE
jgi:hypothetical protein